MSERIIRKIERKEAHGIVAEIAETAYEYGTHYVLFLNGHPGFHSVDFDRVEKYMNDILYI